MGTSKLLLKWGPYRNKGILKITPQASPDRQAGQIGMKGKNGNRKQKGQKNDLPTNWSKLQASKLNK